MIFRSWNGYCLCACRAEDFPADAHPADAPFSPLVFLVRREPETSRGMFRISSLAELEEAEGVNCLLPCAQVKPADGGTLAAFVAQNGATVLNLAFQNAFSYLCAQYAAKKTGLRVTLVGLGDVGGTVLTGLKLLGRELEQIRIFDPNEAQCRRYEMELNQVLADTDGRVMPRVTVCSGQALFDCDLFLFTASRGVPGLGSGVKDVRMAQYEANRAMLTHYARMAREARFLGIFCQISDPVDHLSRCVFLESNRAENGTFDAAGLLPEQVQGFGLGVMAARAAYYAEKEGVEFTNGRVYGVHGEGLIVANDFGVDYDEAVSQRLTELTRTANLRVRELGFKPYLAPGLSSAAISVLRLVRGQVHYGAVPLNGTYFGCVSRMTRQGLVLIREDICPQLMARITDAHRALREFDY